MQSLLRINILSLSSLKGEAGAKIVDWENKYTFIFTCRCAVNWGKKSLSLSKGKAGVKIVNWENEYTFTFTFKRKGRCGDC